MLSNVIKTYTEICENDNTISKNLYDMHRVNRGLRDLNGKGILTGLTEISEVVGKETKNGIDCPCKGQLFYRGYNIFELVDDFINNNRRGFEETVYLLLFGKLPNEKDMKIFCEVISELRTLPNSFVRDIIMKAPSADMMNSLARSVLTLYSYDERPDDISVQNVLRQCLSLIAIFPMLSVYGYHSYNYYLNNASSFFLHDPKPELSQSENLLYMLRPDGKFTSLEATILDLALVLHAEHGGGNNSTFTTHVVTSSGTDTYSSVAASLASLKGPKHGGANKKVMSMMKNIEENISDFNDDEEISNYLLKLINKEAFDKSGLVYGIGHAVYSLSDPRAVIFKSFVEKLAKEKGRENEFKLYSNIERIAPELISSKRKMYKGVSANIDFYSGFVYSMLKLPEELYTPLFACSRIAGWSAHRIEEIVNAGKIIRPAYMNVKKREKYIPMDKRD